MQFQLISNDQRKWIEQALKNCDQVLCGIEKQTETPLASVYKISTRVGTCYFKSGIGSEARNTLEIAKVFPALIPEVIESNIERNWILLKDGGSRLSEVNKVSAWHESIKTLAEFHRNQVGEQWACFPQSEFSSTDILKAFNEFWFDSDFLKYYDIDESIVKYIRAANHEINNSIEAVASMKMNACVCHGDAQPMNCLVGKNGISWFDLREARVSSPLIDIGWFLSWLMPPRPKLSVAVSEDFLNEICNVYLNEVNVSRPCASIYNIMQFALIHRVAYFHNQSIKNKACRPYVEYLSKLLFRVLKRKIG